MVNFHIWTPCWFSHSKDYFQSLVVFSTSPSEIRTCTFDSFTSLLRTGASCWTWEKSAFFLATHLFHTLCKVLHPVNLNLKKLIKLQVRFFFRQFSPNCLSPGVITSKFTVLYITSSLIHNELYFSIGSTGNFAAVYWSFLFLPI